MEEEDIRVERIYVTELNFTTIFTLKAINHQ